MEYFRLNEEQVPPGMRVIGFHEGVPIINKRTGDPIWFQRLFEGVKHPGDLHRIDSEGNKAKKQRANGWKSLSQMLPKLKSDFVLYSPAAEIDSDNAQDRKSYFVSEDRSLALNEKGLPIIVYSHNGSLLRQDLFPFTDFDRGLISNLKPNDQDLIRNLPLHFLMQLSKHIFNSYDLRVRFDSSSAIPSQFLYRINRFSSDLKTKVRPAILERILQENADVICKDPDEARFLTTLYGTEEDIKTYNPPINYEHPLLGPIRNKFKLIPKYN